MAKSQRRRMEKALENPDTQQRVKEILYGRYQRSAARHEELRRQIESGAELIQQRISTLEERFPGTAQVVPDSGADGGAEPTDGGAEPTDGAEPTGSA